MSKNPESESPTLGNLFSPVRIPKCGFQWEPNHYQESMGLIPVDSPHAKMRLSGKQPRPDSTSSVECPPFGLDFERKQIDVEDIATGYKVGGPKETRLFRVALLKNDRECDHLFPVKVMGIPDIIQEEELAIVFKEFGQIGNIYVPRDGESRKAVAPFAIVYFVLKSSADNALLKGTTKIHSKYCGHPNPFTVNMVPSPKQTSTFTKNSGVHGITNSITQSMINTFDSQQRHREYVPQNITLEECFSRSGYPWGSKQELKILEGHAPPEVRTMDTLHLFNLNEYTSPNKIISLFKDDYHLDVGDCYCPRPLIITERLNDGRFNEGFGFLRFRSRYDMNKALKAINSGLIVIDNNTITAEVMRPYQWPRDEFRRYW
jgi:hypothetical protein